MNNSESFRITSNFVIWTLVAICFARIINVVSKDGETPFLSANDRSRWSTVAVLLDDRTFALDSVMERRDKLGRSRPWYSIDMVKHADSKGDEHYYSSKPPLLTILYTGVVWVVMVLFQARLSEQPLLVGRASLLLLNLLPMIAWWFWWRAEIVSRVQELWHRWFLLLAGLFATFLTTMVVTLNNHLHAAFCSTFCIAWMHDLLKRRRGEPASGSLYFACIGLFAGLTVVCELPALAWAAIIPLAMFDRRSWFADWSLYLVGLVPVLGLSVLANWYVHGDWQPPYVHREVLGQLELSLPKKDLSLDSVDDLTVEQKSELLEHLVAVEVAQKLGLEDGFRLAPARRLNTLTLFGISSTTKQSTRIAVTLNDESIELHRWNDWYDYPKSYWLPGQKKGVDLGVESPIKYAFAALFGTYGIFSLSPIYMLIFPGLYCIAKSGSFERNRIAWAIAITSFVCILFYLRRDQLDRNFGGVCCGFRWQFWLIPGWLWLCIANFEAIEKVTAWQAKWLYGLSLLLLLVSIFSAWFAASNPWQYPWIYQWFNR